MSELAIIRTAPAPLSAFTITAEAMAMREQALAASGLVGRVSTPAENETAVLAQTELKRASSLFEKARVEVTKPLLDAQRTIKATVDGYRKDLEDELLRVSRLIGDFQTLELQKLRAAEAARQAEATKLEQERMAAIAQAKTHQEVEAIQAAFSDRAAIESKPPIEPVRAEGQTVSTDWEITRINEHQLAKARPDLVRRIEFDMRALKDCLKRGERLPGVEAREVVKANVRLTTAKAIDV